MDPALPPVESAPPGDEPPLLPSRARRRVSPTIIIALPCLVLGVVITVLGIWPVLLGQFAARVLALAAVLILLGLPVLAGWMLSRVGRRRNWPAKLTRSLMGAGVAVWIAALGFGMISSFNKVRDSSKLKAMLPRQPAAAIDQFYLEYPYRIFLKYDEIVGPDKYMKAYNATDGEDLRVQFPIRQGWSDLLPVRLPDGTTVQRIEVIAAIGKSGLVATYPFPQGDQYDPKRVYRLDCGVSFRDWHVVDLPPDPAGREGRDQDGVHTYQFPDGRRFEITYRSGVPDGPFRAYHADGAPWGEATYRKGRVVEAWLITRDGRKFDELKDGEAAQKAVSDSLAAASRGVRDSGLQKLGAKDYAGALADLNRALAVNPRDAELHRARADAYRATGNLDGAINDYGAAEGFTPEQLGDYRMPEQLRSLVLARGRQRQQAGDPAGAARDFAAIGKDAGWAAEEMLRNHDFAGAMRLLDPAIAAAPVAELLAARADARRMLPGQQAAAEADYAQAVELARQGKMQMPANQRVLPAHWLYKRGHVRRWLGNFTGAAEDFRAALPQLGTGTIINRSDAACWLFLVQCEAGHRDEAGRELQATDRKDWWPAGHQTARFLLGEITEAELDAAGAKSNQDGDRLKAELLSGLVRRQAGDAAGALERFRKAARRSNHDTIEMDVAQREAGQALSAAGPAGK
jgi:tetratricopeptide (TPR) repeat protein